MFKGEKETNKEARYFDMFTTIKVFSTEKNDASIFICYL